MRVLKAIPAALLLFTVATAAQGQSALNEILNSGVLKVGTTGDWNPMTMRDPATNAYTGYDIDVMTELAKDLGVEVEFVATDWKTLVSGVTSGKYHMTGSASISPARAKAAGYSTSYFSLATVPLILAEDKDRFMDWADLDKPDVVVAATLGTVQEKYVKRFFPNAQYKIVEAPAAVSGRTGRLPFGARRPATRRGVAGGGRRRGGRGLHGAHGQARRGTRLTPPGRRYAARPRGSMPRGSQLIFIDLSSGSTLAAKRRRLRSASS